VNVLHVWPWPRTSAAAGRTGGDLAIQEPWNAGVGTALTCGDGQAGAHQASWDGNLLIRASVRGQDGT
jgi:hypothetical protein